MATLQITSFPAQVSREEFLSISGVSQELAGRPLTLTVDNQFQTGAGVVPSNGLWSFRFRFTTAGNRSVVVSAQDNAGNTVRSQAVTIAVSNTTPPLLQITTLPAQVRLNEELTVRGIAQGLDGRPLTLTVDDRFQFALGTIPTGGNWGIQFRFNTPGNRRLTVSATNAQGNTFSSPPANILVLDGAPPTIEITSFPDRVAARQAFTISGRSSGLIGQPVTLAIDNQFRTAAGLVADDGSWQTTSQFLQTGTRRLTASVDTLSTPIISNTVTITVIAAAPRLLIVPPTQPIMAQMGFVLTGEARGFANGEQLVIRVDGQFVVARPIVQNQRWQATLLFNQPGQRVVEVIASDQERAQIVLNVQPSPMAINLFPRNIWTANPTPESLPNLLNPGRITLHHTVIVNLPSTATQSQEIQRMRQVRDIHLNSSGYSDIGYHYIVMPSGRVYEGRSSRKRGAHDVINDGIGVAVDGDFQGSLRVGPQQYEAVVAICTMLCRQLGISDPVNPVSTVTADFGTRSLPRILGHRDRVATICPGTLYARLGEIRRDVRQNL
ncbi:N-acetylmuramoyl-L-alanine amidase [Egbenema bharatensis]|uniref:N-acetylmuramoyl-L-alanine amidase n=1 Tax=Egbenema bharatensis TaxID=3463334 RepID=UPI003A8B27B3